MLIRNGQLIMDGDIVTSDYNIINRSSFTGINSNIVGYQAGLQGGDIPTISNVANSNFFGYQSAFMGANGYAINNANVFGYQAGANIGNGLTGYGGNFFGYQAGNYAFSAIYSNMFGYQAGMMNGSYQGNNRIDYSNFIGYKAGFLATQANNSIFIGKNAGNGYRNLGDTYDGASGLKNISTASSILIGNETSTYGFSDSVAIGAGAGNSAANQLNLGNSLWINGIHSGSASNTSITNAKVGINTNTPSYELDVVGTIHGTNLNISTNITGAIIRATSVYVTSVFSASNVSCLTLTASTVLLKNGVLFDYNSSNSSVILQNSTGSYNAAFFDYVAISSSNLRSGTVFSCFTGSNIHYTEYSTTDIGDTSQVTMSVDLNNGNVRLLSTVPVGYTWNIKAFGRYL